MTTVDGISPGIERPQTQAVVTAAQRTVRDAEQILASMPAEAMASIMQNLSSALGAFSSVLAQFGRWIMSRLVRTLARIGEVTVNALAALFVAAVVAFAIGIVPAWMLMARPLRPQTAPRSTHARGPMRARAPGALRMILHLDIRRERLAM